MIADEHDGEAGGDVLGAQGRDVAGGLRVAAGGGGFSVEELGHDGMIKAAAARKTDSIFRRSDSKASSVAVAGTRMSGSRVTSSREKGRGMAKLSHVRNCRARPKRACTGRTGISAFWARKTGPEPSEYFGPRGPSGVMAMS